MQLILAIPLLIVGLAMLVAGGEGLVRGASSLAKRFRISELIIGLTVVAFGTSCPELIVNIFASMGGHSEIVFGNIIGSNIFNILVILGISALIRPIQVQRNTVWKEIPFSLVAVVLLLVLVNDKTLWGGDNTLSRIDGMILLLFFAGFMVYAIRSAKTSPPQLESVKQYSVPITLLLLALGFGLLFLGGKLTVDSAVSIAKQLGISEKLIALTIIAGGTSLPELATSTIAAYHKKFDIAIGNIVGSNIFNIFFILGISGVIRGTHFDPMFNIDLWVLILATIMLFLSMFTGKVRRIDRPEAVIFLLIYAAYVVLLVFLG